MHDATIVEICPATDCNRMQRTATHCNTHAQCEHNQDMRDRPTRIQRKWEPRWHHNIKLHPHPWDTHYQFSINIVLSHDDYEECAHRTSHIGASHQSRVPETGKEIRVCGGGVCSSVGKGERLYSPGPPFFKFCIVPTSLPSLWKPAWPRHVLKVWVLFATRPPRKSATRNL